MLKFKAFLCALFSLRCGPPNISVDKVKFEIFDTHSSNFEQKIFNSLQSTQNFFADDDVKQMIEVGATALKFVPFIGQMDEVILTVTGLLEDESDWKGDFSKTISGETMRSIADNQIDWMQAQLKTIRKNIPLLDKQRQPNRQNRIANAQYIHNTFDTMINYLAEKRSVFKKFPLVTSPLIISLSLLIATFIPIANKIIPIERKQLQVACKTRDILEEYRRRTFIARTDKLNTIYDHYSVMLTELTKPYSPLGYNKNNDSDILHCYMGCDLPESEQNLHCLLDEFSEMKYSYKRANPQSQSISNRCIREYTGLVRHRVEQMFPVDIFGKFCANTKTKRKPTGKSPKSFFFKFYKLNFIEIKKKTFLFFLIRMDRKRLAYEEFGCCECLWKYRRNIL